MFPVAWYSLSEHEWVRGAVLEIKFGVCFSIEDSWPMRAVDPPAPPLGFLVVREAENAEIP
jgi:hypothetical protein